MLTDNFNRVHDYLRISLTDSCNFRCSYCMPEENFLSMHNVRLMQPDEIEAIAAKFIQLGIKKIRLTGGEPMVRREFPEIVARLAKYPIELTMTTNGVFAHKFIHLMQDVGIKNLNISLDSLQPEIFHKLTKRNQFKRVWENILLLLSNGFKIKINVVALDGLIQQELIDFVYLTKDLPLHVRFIEFMPFSGNNWNSSKVLTANKMLSMVLQNFEVVKLKDEPNATAKKYKVIGHVGTFAFISTMSEHFCGSCNRMRLTADGKMKNCLFGKEEMDLLGTLRQGKDIEPLIRLSLLRKGASLGGQMAADFNKTEAHALENRSMIGIGG